MFSPGFFYIQIVIPPVYRQYLPVTLVAFEILPGHFVVGYWLIKILMIKFHLYGKNKNGIWKSNCR
jgi:hypothetical protein